MINTISFHFKSFPLQKKNSIQKKYIKGSRLNIVIYTEQPVMIGRVMNALVLKAPITTKVVCFCRLLNSLEASWSNSVDPDQTAPVGAV